MLSILRASASRYIMTSFLYLAYQPSCPVMQFFGSYSYLNLEFLIMRWYDGKYFTLGNGIPLAFMYMNIPVFFLVELIDLVSCNLGAFSRISVCVLIISSSIALLSIGHHSVHLNLWMLLSVTAVCCGKRGI